MSVFKSTGTSAGLALESARTVTTLEAATAAAAASFAVAVASFLASRFFSALCLAVAIRKTRRVLSKGFDGINVVENALL